MCRANFLEKPVNPQSRASTLPDYPHMLRKNRLRRWMPTRELRVLTHLGAAGQGSDLLFKHADLVFMESTYGDKDHPSRKALRDGIQRRFGLRSEMPAHREVIEC